MSRSTCLRSFGTCRYTYATDLLLVGLVDHRADVGVEEQPSDAGTERRSRGRGGTRRRARPHHRRALLPAIRPHQLVKRAVSLAIGLDEVVRTRPVSRADREGKQAQLHGVDIRYRRAGPAVELREVGEGLLSG